MSLEGDRFISITFFVSGHRIEHKGMRKDLKSLENYQKYSENWNTQRFLKGEDYPVAMAYVPWQRWGTLYDPEKGLECGTIFPDLNKPFLGVRGGCR